MTTRTTITKDDNGNFARSPVNSKKLARDITARTDVDVPVKSAVATMIFIFMMFMAFALYQEKQITTSYIGLSAMVCIAFGFAAFILRMKWLQSVLYSTETVVHRDIDGDGYIGEPSHPVLVNKGNTNNRRDPAREYQKRFEQYVEFVFLNGLEHHLARKEFSELEITTFRSYLIQLNICKWKNSKNHNSGLEFVLDYDDTLELIQRTPWVDVDRAGTRTRK